VIRKRDSVPPDFTSGKTIIYLGPTLLLSSSGIVAKGDRNLAPG